MKKILIVFLLVWSFSIYGQAPDWYVSGSIPSHTAESYILGIGEGQTYDEALANAQNSLASQLRVSIKSSQEIFVRETSSNGETELLEQFEQKTISSVSETLTGAEVIKQEIVSNKYFVLVGINRLRFANTLRAELTDLEGEINSFLNGARKDLEKGLIIPAIDNYSKAYDKLQVFYGKKGFYDSFRTLNPPVMNNLYPGEIVTEIRQVLSQVILEINSGDNQIGDMGKNLPDPVVLKVSYAGIDGVKTPVPNILITIRGKDNKVLYRGNTDSSGIFETYITAVPSQGDRGEVTCRAEIRALALGKINNRDPEIIVRYQIESRASVPVTIEIFDHNGQRLRSVEQQIARELVRLGFEIVEDAEIKILGEGSITDEKEMDGVRGTQYVANIEINFNLIDPSGKIINSMSFNGTGLHTKNPDGAITAAYSKLGINKKELTEFMSGVK